MLTRTNTADRPSPFNPLYQISLLVQERNLIYRLISHELMARYRNSILGVFWSVLVPLAQLAVFYFVFTHVMPGRWQTADGANTNFAVVLFSGVITFSFMAEVVTRSPALLLENVSYLKKVVFPVYVLPVVASGVAAANFAVSLLVLVVCYMVLNFSLPPLQFIALPLIILPFLILVCGLSWLLASLGVYLRDIRYIVGPATSLLMFLGPVFIPAAAIPEQYRGYVFLNPITMPIEQIRQALLSAQWPDFAGLALYSVIAVIIAWIGSWVFLSLRQGFSDVV